MPLLNQSVEHKQIDNLFFMLFLGSKSSCDLLTAPNENGQNLTTGFLILRWYSVGNIAEATTPKELVILSARTSGTQVNIHSLAQPCNHG